MFVVTIYYGERIQVKISQRKRQWARVGEGSHPQSVPCPEDSLLPWHRCVVVHTQYCQPGKLTPASVSRFCIEASVHRHDRLVHWLPIWLNSPSGPLTQSPHLNQIVGLSGMASPHPATIGCGQAHPKIFIANKDTSVSGGTDYLSDPSKQGQILYYTVC